MGIILINPAPNEVIKKLENTAFGMGVPVAGLRYSSQMSDGCCCSMRPASSWMDGNIVKIAWVTTIDGYRIVGIGTAMFCLSSSLKQKEIAEQVWNDDNLLGVGVLQDAVSIKLKKKWKRIPFKLKDFAYNGREIYDAVLASPVISGPDKLAYQLVPYTE